MCQGNSVCVRLDFQEDENGHFEEKVFSSSEQKRGVVNSPEKISEGKICVAGNGGQRLSKSRLRQGKKWSPEVKCCPASGFLWLCHSINDNLCHGASGRTKKDCRPTSLPLSLPHCQLALNYDIKYRALTGATSSTAIISGDAATVPFARMAKSRSGNAWDRSNQASLVCISSGKRLANKQETPRSVS